MPLFTISALVPGNGVPPVPRMHCNTVMVHASIHSFWVAEHGIISVTTTLTASKGQNCAEDNMWTYK
jgi:hypothetical protein